jgi:hypothetical protein
MIYSAYICVSHSRRGANMNEVNIHAAGWTFDRVWQTVAYMKDSV